MKLKTIVGLIVIVVMLLGVMVGCKASEEEEVFGQVSVGTMTVSIPSNWESGEEYFEKAFKAGPEAFQKVTTIAAYYDKSKETILACVVMDMRQFAELQEISWEGWEAALKDADLTKEQYAGLMSSSFMGKVEELTRKVHHELMIHDNEAWESQYTCKWEGERTRINVLVIFPEDDMVLVMTFVREAEWKKFEETWGKIRDSIQLAP